MMLQALHVEIAERIAEQAHEGQVDKAGKPLFAHVRRVALAMIGEGYGIRQRTVAWLHDVLEDSDWTEAKLRAIFPRQVVDDVVALTHLDGEPLDDYWARVRARPHALQVKRADVLDNSNRDRLALLDEALRDRLVAKYARAWSALHPEGN